MRPLIQLNALNTKVKGRIIRRLERVEMRLGGWENISAPVDCGFGRRTVRVMTRLSRSCSSIWREEGGVVLLVSSPLNDDAEVAYEAVVDVAESEDDELTEFEPKAEGIQVPAG